VDAHGAKGLLGGPSVASLFAKEQKEEKAKAFDLLAALSKSGALEIEEASLHVAIAATHCFDRTLLDTVIQENVNPIDKVERSHMIVGSTIHGRPAAELLAADQRERFLETSPELGPAKQGWSGSFSAGGAGPVRRNAPRRCRRCRASPSGRQASGRSAGWRCFGRRPTPPASAPSNRGGS
jgi:hypothetical protein